VKVLVIPEDQELDRYIVKPVIEALFDDLRMRAAVDVLPEPRLRGAGDALDHAMIDDIVAKNPMVDLFVLVVDRDCDRMGNEGKARALQTRHEGKLLACVAQQEIEVWMLALHWEDLRKAHGLEYFSTVRAHCDPKEEWAEPLLESLGSGGPGRGRKRAMRAIAGQWRSLRGRCDELAALQEAVVAWDSARRG
jgi:hypothetical protein